MQLAVVEERPILIGLTSVIQQLLVAFNSSYNSDFGMNAHCLDSVVTGTAIAVHR